MWTRKNRGNVFVGNLPKDFPDEKLAEAFDPFGIVLSAAVARDPATGERLRYGFVDIATEKAAAAAIGALNGSRIDGCKLNVKPSEKPAKKAPASGPRRTARPMSRTPLGGRAADPQPAPHFAEPRAVAPYRYPAAAPHHYPASRPPREPARPAADENAPVPEFPPASSASPAERPFQVQVVRRRTPNFQVERRPLPRRV